LQGIGCIDITVLDKTITWDNYLDNLEIYDYIFKSPWISPYTNNLQKFKSKILSQTKLFFELYTWKIISITQTKWKSTTATLVYELLKNAWYKVKFVWNIWNPVLEEVDLFNSENDSRSVISSSVILGLDPGISSKEKHLENTKDSEIIKSNVSKEVLISSNELIDSWSSQEWQHNTNFDFVIYELSSYMLDDLDNHHSFISIIWNIYEDHLDWHGGFENYKNAKLNILNNAENLLIWETLSKEIKEKLKDKNYKTFWLENSYYAHKWTDFSINSEKLKQEIKPLIPWEHNLSNIWAILWVCDILKIDLKILEKTINTFPWLPYRLQNIWTYNWITFIDDANATTPEASIAAINAFWDQINTIFLGWSDRWYNFKDLIQTIINSNIKNIVFFPESWIRIFFELNKQEWKSFNHIHTSSMSDAVEFAYKYTSKWKVCLLSCASPSYSIWKNFEEKGDLFKKEILKQNRD
jgi:UDP-N-acetylmuramoylalanine-D-glutamate ligase